MDYNKSIEIARNIFWVGYNDEKNGLHSNPYLIIEGNEAILIDGGSRPDFSTVMMKILQTGLNPDRIVRLVYQHYDPDLVGSISNFESIINNNELEVISQKQNNIFITHYSTTSKLNCINKLGKSWGFRTGRRLKFINTPYAHSPGSFMTYDEETKTLFSSDIFGSYGQHWDLYLEIDEKCKTCTTYNQCPIEGKICFLPGLIKFHQVIMTSKAALKHALENISSLDIELIAPQHGSIIKGKDTIQFLITKLLEVEDIGIDGVENFGDDHIC